MYAVNNGNLCPTGWHVLSKYEWTILITFPGGEDVAGGKLKETGTTHWKNPNTGATIVYSFTALPGGDRNLYGQFGGVNDYAICWSSTDVNGKSYEDFVKTRPEACVDASATQVDKLP
ncbi:MAG: hypothetical protein EHM47_09195 [Ignavibacteriales bacterium]|nr:MAG: hypothetical protein EHM47_09195 [Ignavibacteriales bacterium]